MDGGEYGLQAPKPISDEVFIDVIWRSVWATGTDQGFRFGLWVLRGGQGVLEDPQSCVCVQRKWVSTDFSVEREGGWQEYRFFSSLFLFLPTSVWINTHRLAQTENCLQFLLLFLLLYTNHFFCKSQGLERWRKSDWNAKAERENKSHRRLHLTPNTFSLFLHPHQP